MSASVRFHAILVEDENVAGEHTLAPFPHGMAQGERIPP
jgi:hypothetical protein